MIREAVTADAHAIRAIQTAALAEPWSGLLDPAIEGPPLVLVSTAADDAVSLSGSTTTDQPVGYAIALPEGERAYLAELAVAPGYRRAGRGSALLDAVAGRLERAGVDRLRLTVRLDDDRARGFYETQGFRVHSLLPAHYESGDGLVLVRRL